MGFLGKRLSSVLLCGSMAFTIANSAGVVYAADNGQNVEEMAEQQNNANEGEEAQNEENEDSEVENNNEAQDVGDAKDVKGASTSGSSNGSGTAVGAGLLVGGLGAGAAIDRGIDYLKDKSKANNSSSSVSEEEVKKEIERQVEEARKDAGKMASVADNTVYGALSGWIGALIPNVDSMVSDQFGKNLSRSSRAAIVAAIIIHIIGLMVACSNALGLVRNWGDKDKPGKTWRILKIGTGILVPPIGIALQLAESIIVTAKKNVKGQHAQVMQEGMEGMGGGNLSEKVKPENEVLRVLHLNNTVINGGDDLGKAQGQILSHFAPYLKASGDNNEVVVGENNVFKIQPKQQINPG